MTVEFANKIIICDICGDAEKCEDFMDFGDVDFKEWIEERKSEGWTVERKGDEWEHYCRSCKGAG